MKVAVIGTGGWGTALAVLLHENGCSVRLWSRLEEEVEPILAARENRLFLPGVKIPEAIVVTLDEVDALSRADMVVLAVPSHGMREVCRRLKPFVPRKAILVHVTKGLENETAKRMSEVIAEELGREDVVALSGPSHAEEVACGVPTAVVVASRDHKLAVRVQEVFMNEYFRVYWHDDLVGVELGGAMKNVVALAAGVCDGIGFGDNTKAALCTRGLAEMVRLGVACGARAETFAGLSGMGDLMVTAFSRHSRNRAFGERLGRGETAGQILASTRSVAEGVRTVRSVCQLADRYGVEMPISREVYAILYAGKSPKQAVRDLMGREAKPEFQN
ncbi:MAG: NAD(P)H-dependent glycerol-3-phosphate dehydrogenase [Verrucomicrobiae bacterium]|nr:NAD(P)H-dependent glycerol-3-phosphate dehydrogenase [Verrucomicrobiae bacterium]